MVLIQLYRSKGKITQEKDAFNNQEFIKTTVKSLKEKMITTSKYMWGYTFLLLLAFNIGYLEVLSTLNAPIRIVIHLMITSAILFFMYAGIKKRVSKNKKDILPLIETLESMIK